ncbi:MAG: hypothetical protein OEZ39_10335 [Gammaproteobacteria bacterium]|nr:hypothetical protein [Gammaproteobacteria bacterium]MDH5652240.1 hypothetical protein [Gammaproteobacteria bacterium]
MTILETTLTKQQAIQQFREISKIAKAVIYLKKIDKEMIFRLGKDNNNKIAHVRHHEDDRPITSYNKRTKSIVSKRNEIITYQENKQLYVLAKSGGVSLFDAMSPKLTLTGKDCWYLVPKNTPIPDGIVIAKDVEPDDNGHFHYAFQPEHDMLMSTYKEKLAEIGKHMRVV